MKDNSSGWIIFLLIIAGSIIKPLIERRKKAYEERQRLQRGTRPPPRPEPEKADEEEAAGPRLPYEDLVEEVFGPHMERRRQAAKARRPLPQAAPPAPALVVTEALPEPAAPAPPAASPPPVETRAGETVPPPKPPGSEKPFDRVPIEERIFRRPGLSPLAKLVLAAEILQPPRVYRGRPGGAFRP
jgi:hypothetical protein